MADTRIMICESCGGDGGHHYPVDIDRRDGSLIERWQECSACAGRGDYEVELEPITCEDLEEFSAGASSSVVTGRAAPSHPRGINL